MIPAEVEQELERLIERLEVATDDYAVMAREAGEAEVGYKVAYAKALLTASGTVAIREATATVATEVEALRRRIAEARVQAQRELLFTIRGAIDAVRTISASLRAGLS